MKYLKLLTISVAVLSSALGMFGAAFADEPRQGLPGRRVGGGSRDSQNACLLGDSTLTALVPADNLVTTTSSNPTLLFHIPAGGRSREVEFVLRDDQDRLVYEDFFEITERSTLRNYQLSSMSQEIVIGSDYQWYLSIICDPSDRAKDVVVHGWLRRIRLSDELSTRLEAASPQEKALLYWESGIWHEAVINTYDVMQTSSVPQIEDQWLQLLQTEGLEWIRHPNANQFYSVTEANERFSKTELED